MVLPKPSLTAPTVVPAHHFTELDGLRGIAVLAVMGYHFGAPFLQGGYLGVDVFFVISGFVVTRNLLRLMTKPGWASLFYGRRVARLYPVLACFGAALVAYWGLQGDLDAGAAVALVGATAMSYNVAASFVGAELDGPLLLWSLAVEWHFYLILPVLLLMARRRIGATARAVALVGLAAIVAGARLWALTIGDVSAFDVYVSTWFRLDGLLLGSALALVSPLVLRLLPPRFLIDVGVAGTVAAMIIGPHWGARAPITLGVIVPAVSVCVLGVVMGVVGRSPSPVRGPVAAALRWGPMVWAGRRSYSLYLWHYFVGVSLLGQGSEMWRGPVLFTVQVGAGMLAAELSYRKVERPARAAINRRLAADNARLRSDP